MEWDAFSPATRVKSGPFGKSDTRVFAAAFFRGLDLLAARRDEILKGFHSTLVVPVSGIIGRSIEKLRVFPNGTRRGLSDHDAATRETLQMWRKGFRKMQFAVVKLASKIFRNEAEWAHSRAGPTNLAMAMNDKKTLLVLLGVSVLGNSQRVDALGCNEWVHFRKPKLSQTFTTDTLCLSRTNGSLFVRTRRAEIQFLESQVIRSEIVCSRAMDRTAPRKALVVIFQLVARRTRRMWSTRLVMRVMQAGPRRKRMVEGIPRAVRAASGWRRWCVLSWRVIDAAVSIGTMRHRRRIGNMTNAGWGETIAVVMACRETGVVAAVFMVEDPHISAAGCGLVVMGCVLSMEAIGCSVVARRALHGCSAAAGGSVSRRSASISRRSVAT